MKANVLVLGLAACGRASHPSLDGGVVIDAEPGLDAEVDAPPTDGTGIPYRHTITVDGIDDFELDDRIATTSSPAYDARITWDDANLYVGYGGPDLAPAALDTATKWLFVYLDLDPGGGTGAAMSEQYNTQRAVFPTGFGAESYVRWKCDATLVSIRQHSAGTWSSLGTVPSAAQAGTFVELVIPRGLLGASTSIGLVTWMINEKDQFEGSFAGLYATNFANGYAAALPITRYLRVDFTSDRPPNDAANQIAP